MNDNSTKFNVAIGATNAAGAVIKEAIGQFGDLWKKVTEGGPAAAIGVASVAGLGVAIGDAIKQAADFDQQVIRLQTSAGELPSNLKLVSDGMLQIARDTGTATQDLTSGMYQVESANYRGKDALEILRAASQGAKIEQADLGKVTDAVTSAMRDYNIPVSQAATLTSQMIAAVGSGKSTFETFTGSLHSVLPIASSLHVPLADIMGDLASMTVHGMSADQATQDLAHSLGKFSGGLTSGMTSELAQLGIDSSTLVNVLSKQGPGGGLSGVVNEISDAITNHLGPSGTVMLNAFNGNKVQAADAIKMMAAMSPQLQNIAQGYKNGTITLAQYRGDLKALPADQASILEQFVSLNSKASGFSDILKSGKNATQDYTQALQAATGDATTFNTALMLGGQNANYTKDAIAAVSKAHADAHGNVKDWAEVQGELNIKLARLGEIVQTGAISLGKVLLPIATDVVNVIISMTTFSVNFGEIFKNIMNDIASVTRSALKIVGDAFKDVTAFLHKHHAIIEQIVGVLTVLFLPALIKLAAQAIATGATVAAQFALMAVKAIAASAVQVVQAVISGAAWILQATLSSAAWVAQFVVMSVKAAATAVIFTAQAVIGGYAWVLQAVKASAAWLIAFPKMAIGGISTAAKFVVQAAIASGSWIAAAASTAVQWAVSFGVMIAGAIRTGVTMLATGARAAVAWLMALGPIGLIIAAIAAVIAITTLLLTHWKQTMSFFQGLGAMVVHAVGDLGHVLFDAGKDIIHGLINGVKSMIGDIGSTIKNVVGGAVNIVKGFLGIHSPSTVFAEIGQNMGQGLIQGIKGIQANANLAVNQLVSPTATGSSSVSNTYSPISTVSNHSSTVGGSSTSIVIQNLVLSTGEAVKQFFDSNDRDAQLQSLGMSPARGVV